MGKRRQVRQPGWGALGHCSPGEGTSARFLRPPNSCCNGICNAALHVENHEGMEGPKKANQVTKDAKESKKIQLCRIVTGLSHDPRKPAYKGQWKALGTWERFYPKFLHERSLFLLHRKCKTCYRTAQPGEIFDIWESPFAATRDD